MALVATVHLRDWWLRIMLKSPVFGRHEEYILML